MYWIPWTRLHFLAFIVINWSDLLANMAHNATLIAYICHLSVIYGFADTRNTCHRPLFAILVLQKNVSFWRGFFRIDGIRINFYRCHQSVTSCIYIYVLCSIYLYYDIYIYMSVCLYVRLYIYIHVSALANLPLLRRFSQQHPTHPRAW